MKSTEIAPQPILAKGIIGDIKLPFIASKNFCQVLACSTKELPKPSSFSPKSRIRSFSTLSQEASIDLAKACPFGVSLTQMLRESLP
jgi:hypothetical protein